MAIGGVKRCTIVAGIFVFLPLIAVFNLSAAPTVDFSRDIQPILAAKCFPCHGPDAAARKAGLRFDLPGSTPVNGKGEPVIVPGRADLSRLVARIRSSIPEERMPPPDSDRVLRDAEKGLLERWIETGAKQQQHWAFIPPRRHPTPKVINSNWPFTPVDAFLLARMEAERATPSPEADPRTLLRRLSFDLTGLQPQPEAMRRFLADPSLEAFGREATALLQSPQFGERMAMLWLDLVRYADSDGYHADNMRPMTPYRDYVIGAFARNVSFRDFTRHQIAGDLLPNAGHDEKIASAYNRLVKTTEENGANENEYLLRYAADRVRNVSSVWLGLTLGCAECHDHESDPLTSRDFYSMSAFFAYISELGVGKQSATLIPTPEQHQRMLQLDRDIVALNQDITAYDSMAEIEPWIERLRRLRQANALRWVPVDIVEATYGTIPFQRRPDGSLLIAETGSGADHRLRFSSSLDEIRALRIEVLRDPAEERIRSIQRLPQGFRLTEFEMYYTPGGGAKQRIALDTAFAEIHSSTNAVDLAFDGQTETFWEFGDDLKPKRFSPNSEIGMGSAAAPAAVRRALAPNSEASDNTKRLEDFTHPSEPRGRGSLRPRRARSPKSTSEFGFSAGFVLKQPLTNTGRGHF